MVWNNWLEGLRWPKKNVCSKSLKSTWITITNYEFCHTDLSSTISHYVLNLPKIEQKWPKFEFHITKAIISIIFSHSGRPFDLKFWLPPGLGLTRARWKNQPERSTGSTPTGSHFLPMAPGPPFTGVQPSFLKFFKKFSKKKFLMDFLKILGLA